MLRDGVDAVREVPADRWDVEDWFSGAIPYPALLALQALIIALYAWVALDFTRGRVRASSRMSRSMYSSFRCAGQPA